VQGGELWSAGRVGTADIVNVKLSSRFYLLWEQEIDGKQILIAN
jgi:hypothetical protein